MKKYGPSIYIYETLNEMHNIWRLNLLQLIYFELLLTSQKGGKIDYLMGSYFQNKNRGIQNFIEELKMELLQASLEPLKNQLCIELDKSVRKLIFLYLIFFWNYNMRLNFHTLFVHLWNHNWQQNQSIYKKVKLSLISNVGSSSLFWALIWLLLHTQANITKSHFSIWYKGISKD